MLMRCCMKMRWEPQKRVNIRLRRMECEEQDWCGIQCRPYGG